MGDESENSFTKDVKTYIKGTVFENCNLAAVLRLFNKLSWYIKAGYCNLENSETYLTSINRDVKAILGPRRSVDEIFEDLRENNFSIISEDDKVIAVINNIRVPLFVLKEALKKPINVEGTAVNFTMQNNNMNYKHNTPTHIPTTKLQRFFTVSDPKILTVRSSVVAPDHPNEDFVSRNSGSVFRVFSADPFVSTADLNDCFKKGQFNSNSNDPLVSYYKATNLLLAIESEQSATTILKEGLIPVNGHTGSVLFKDLLSIKDFKDNFKKYLQDNFTKQPQIIISKGKLSSDNTNETVTISSDGNIDYIIERLNNIISQSD